MSEQHPETPANDTYAAIDLGSNSFHMIVAREDNGQVHVIDRIKEMVRLGEGLTPDRRITEPVRERALACLSRFGQRLRGLPHSAVRAVGTNTLRQVNDGGEFLRAAEEALGHPIEIIAGREEARLVYLGVAHGFAASEQKRLVVDIGGGSTELIVGSGMEPLARESLFMGCVSFSQRFFTGGAITKQAMDAAIIAGQLEIRPLRKRYHSGFWSEAVGSSGSIKAIRNVVQAMGWSEQGITRKSLKQLRKALIVAGHIDNIALDGLSEERRPVFAGGVAVLSAVFKALDIEVMRVSDLALREGVLYEMLDLAHDTDIRAHTVETLIKRYHLDKKQGYRVESTANLLLRQIAAKWGIGDLFHVNMLRWAARLHEIGLIISHSGFHKHSAYILANADLPGFTRQQQAILAAIVRSHRRQIAIANLNELPPSIRQNTLHLIIILRLAALLHRGRSQAKKPLLYIDVDENRVELRFPDGWLEEHPLTTAELQAEATYLNSAGLELIYQ